MARAEASNLATEDGLQAILNLIDPFPDDATEAVGWPSYSNSATLPMIMTDYKDITPPANVTKTWAFKAMFLPIDKDIVSNTITTWDELQGGTTAPVANVAAYGQFNVWKWRSEDPEPSIMDPPDTIITLSAVDRTVLSRFTMAGFELINTSTDLYRGGMYYGWRSPMHRAHDLVAYTGTTGQTAQPAFARFYPIIGAPDSLGDVINLNTTIVNHARDGVGVFSLPMTIENPFIAPMPTNYFLVGRDVNDLLHPPSRYFNPTSAAPSPWQLCGAYVTGLASEATFQLRARIGLELKPTADTGDIFQSLAHKPVPRSFLLEEMLNQLLLTTPAGFDYSENPLGEWLGKVLQGLAAVVPTIAGVIPHPAAKVIGGVAGPALQALGQKLEGASTKKNHRPLPPIPQNNNSQQSKKKKKRK